LNHMYKCKHIKIINFISFRMQTHILEQNDSTCSSTKKKDISLPKRQYKTCK
jgi:hypothetical protein